MRILREKASGKLIEMQSDAHPGTLLENALSAGYSADDVEELEASREDFAVALEKAQKDVKKVKPLTIVDQIIADPDQLRKLKTAIGL